MDDIKFTLRLAQRRPTYTITVIMLMAFAIGVNTALFSVIDATFLRPLPVHDPDSLVRIVQLFPKSGPMDTLPRAFYETLRDHSTSLSAVLGEASITVTLTGLGRAESIRVYLPTPRYFQELGVKAIYGRTLMPSDDENRGGPVPAVVSYNFWRQRLNGRRNAVGQTLIIHKRPFTIVGILPMEFNGLSADTAPDVRVPLTALPLLWQNSSNLDMAYVDFQLAGRVRRGVTRKQAEDECRALWLSNISGYYPAFPEQASFLKSIPVVLEPLRRGVSIVGPRYGDTLRLLAMLGIILLLSVCSTLGGLLFAQTAGRRTEMAMRLALGATRTQLVRQIIVECMLLSSIGAVGALVVRVAVMQFAVHYVPPLWDVMGTPIALAVDLRLNRAVMIFITLVCAGSALLFGIVPAVLISRTNVDPLLREVRMSSRVRGRQILIAVQIAISMCALILAALLIQTMRKLMQVNTGLDQGRILTFSLDPVSNGYTPPQEAVLISNLATRLRTLPGVRSVGLAAFGVMRGHGIAMTVARVRDSADLPEDLNTSVNYVSPEYFQTMGIRVLSGEDLQSLDLKQKPRSIVVNQEFANHFFPHDLNTILGAQIGAANGGQSVQPEYRIVGIVANAKYRSLREPMVPVMYVLTDQFSSFVMSVSVQGDPRTIIRPILQIVSAEDPSLPLKDIGTLADDVRVSTAGESLAMGVAVAFGSIQALITSCGLYGLFAYILRERTWEVAVRLALGATRRAVVVFLMRNVVLFVVGGVGFGVLIGLACGALLRSTLYGVVPTDGQSLTLALSCMAVVLTAGSLWPLRRAATVQPAEALRLP